MSQIAGTPNGSRPLIAQNTNNLDSVSSSGTVPDAPPATAGHVNPQGKKSKNKKATDPNETGKLLAAKINQLELDAVAEKDQEAEIEREVKKATKDLNNLLTGIENPLSKLDTLQKRYSDLFTEMKRVERENAKNKKKSDLLQKEKDQGRSELNKTNSMKEKLEKLCRELQRENKKLKDEQKKMEDNERRSREEFSKRTDEIFGELNDAMEQVQNPETQKSNIEQDELFRQKFKSFIEQYELRELHYNALSKMKECEIQLSQSRYEEQRKRAETDAKKARSLGDQVSTFSQTETELRSQLNIYVEKFKQVEDTLNNSNDLFLTFRREMEEMSKKTKRLEKDNLSITRKHDLTSRNIIEMAEDRTNTKKEVEALRKRNTTLENVIRGMQNQGRAPAGAGAVDVDEEGTESDYEEDDYEDDEGSEEGEYEEEDTEEELPAPTYGPVPPPPPPSQTQVNGHVTNGEVNGFKHVVV